MVRPTLTLTGILIPAFLLAQSVSPNLGTKSDIMRAGTAKPTGQTMDPAQLLPMLVALGLVFFLLKYALPKVVAKFNKGMSTSLNSPIMLEESASFATGTLQVVTVRGKSLLLAVTPQGVTCLSEVPTTLPGDPVPAFFEILDRESENPKAQTVVTHAVVEQAAEPKPNPAVKAYAANARPRRKSATPSREELLERLAHLQGLVDEK
ncbi:MAG: flagellar biosynthetic protein FliO [Armatimonadetes bacterium]|nr:flagellar biosynthetic protein FliO [Armatimonadota bacterium]MBS1711338.1 flagellar biosynthetic protein FliO [Armatimonadota bacterium]MBX3107737.1 flagellar biosynthetic protein FliO [Fimbriimonadaceae bacterium]